MSQKLFFLAILLLLIFNTFSLSQPVLAQSKGWWGAESTPDTGHNYLATIGDWAFGVSGRPATPVEILARIIRIVLTFLGIVFIIVILYGGFLWMTASGNEDQIKKARSLITNGIIGVIIIIAAYAITFFVIERVQKAVNL